MKTNKIIAFLVSAVTFSCIGISSCTWDKPEVPDSSGTSDSVENPIDTMNNPGFDCPDYPDDVKTIIVSKCATAGCHNAISYAGASGLNLTSWLTMRRGNSAGAVVIPGNPDYSTLFSFCNTYTDLGFAGNDPKMPLNSTALSRDEITTLKNWINDGAKNSCGDLMFPDNSSKIYITNQACDQMVVVDKATRLIRKWFDIGSDPGLIENPHVVKLTPDGTYFLVAFFKLGIVQRFRVSDDSFVDQVDISNGVAGQWGTLAISPDGKNAYCVEYGLGRISTIHLENFPMTYYTTSSLGGVGFTNPHGIATNQNGTKLYITDQVGSNIYIIDTASTYDNYSNIAIPNLITVHTTVSKIHEIVFSHDYTKYFITGESNSEVLVYNTSDNSLLATIGVGSLPQEFSFSTTKPYLFVSCTEDIGPQGRGCVAVIDLNTLTLFKKIYTGTQPHGLAVDDEKEVVYVANRNANANGDAPHHAGACAGRNGYLTIIDMNTWELVPGYKCELGVDPYSVTIKN